MDWLGATDLTKGGREHGARRTPPNPQSLYPCGCCSPVPTQRRGAAKERGVAPERGEISSNVIEHPSERAWYLGGRTREPRAADEAETVSDGCKLKEIRPNPNACLPRLRFECPSFNT
eukprot:scaffold199502_cov32-Tisochrysis_lutea.AAC.1